MNNYIKSITLSILLIAMYTSITFAQTNEDSLIVGAPNIYIDCASCDFDFLRRDITFVNFVRDRKQADVHILVSRESNGGGGRKYTVEFIGLNQFDGMKDTLKFSTVDSDTDDMIRDQMSKTFKLGLVRFVAHSQVAKDLAVNYNKPAETKEVIDKWKKWVFNLNFNGYLNGQKSYRYISLYNNFSASKVTEMNKYSFSFYFNYNENKYDYVDYKALSISRSKGTSGDFIFGINDHWSYTFAYNVYTSTYGNIDISNWVGSGLEYNIYPYSESSRRQLRLEYYLGAKYVDYTEETIYYKTNEWLFSQNLSINLSLIQPWGTISTSLYGQNYLHDFSKNYLQLYTTLSLRIVEGLSFDINGNVSRVRNQLGLPIGGATQEEVLLQRKELETNYNYWMSIGITYSFGSIYNNIVNPRFGG